MESISIFSTFVIESPEKRTSIAGNQLRSLGYEYTSVPATFYESFPETFDHKSSWIKLRRHLSLPEVGCAESHMICYRKFLESDTQLALIFEDDALISNKDLFVKYLSKMENFDSDTNFCISFFTKFATVKTSDIQSEFFYSVVDVPSSTVCYVISRGSAKKLLQANEKHTYNADWPKNTGIKFYLAKQLTIETGHVESFMLNNRGTVDISTMERLLIMLSIFLGIHFFRYHKFFKSFNEYFCLLISPTLRRTSYRLLSRKLPELGNGIRIPFWH
jgi:hypothetical protein